MEKRSCIAIDLKSFYASVECVERGLDPLTTNLVVADTSRTEKTICLAVSPSLKAYGIPGRARLFEVVQKVGAVNAQRRRAAPGHAFTGASISAPALRDDPGLELDYLVAPPRMARYMEVSTQIYQIYLKYIAPEDIHVYSIDEVFIEATSYLSTYGLTARELAMRMIHDVLASTGITATAGLGTNLFLAKVAMDVEAKHIAPDRDGVRIAELDEMSYRRAIWPHRPITDIWRVGRGYAKKLEERQMFTMGDVARCSVQNEALLYKLFGVNAELLIDHAWGWEPCTMADIKAYRPASSSLSAGQVLPCPYDFDKGRLIVREMTEQMALELVDKGLVTDQLVLTIGYDRESLTDPERRRRYSGAVTTDYYGRKVPKPAHGSETLPRPTSSTRRLMDAVTALYDRIVDGGLLLHRVTLTANRVVDEAAAETEPGGEQLDLFTDYEAEAERRAAEDAELRRERRGQEAVLTIKRKYGKNAIVKGMNLEEGATAIQRNRQIGGHKA